MHFSSSLNVGIRGERVYVDKNGDAEKILFLLDMRWPNTCELYLLTIFFSLCYYYNYYSYYYYYIIIIITVTGAFLVKLIC